jgi:hypothetical protein
MPERGGVARNLTLQMDAFGARALEGFMGACGESLSGVLRLATDYYISDADKERFVWLVPGQSAQPASGPTGLDFAVDDETWRSLVEEARRQDVDLGALAAHAILYFLADWDSGRVAERFPESSETEATGGSG